MKKFIKILIVLLVIAAIVLVCLNLFGKKNDENVALDEETALQIARLKYEGLLNFADANYLQFAKTDESINSYNIDGKIYFQIENFEQSIQSSVADEYLSEFCEIARIIQKDGSYYIRADINTIEKDSTYDSTNLIVKNINNNEIICEAQSTYVNSVDNTLSTISQNFILKNINGEWKAIEFSLPY